MSTNCKALWITKRKALYKCIYYYYYHYYYYLEIFSGPQVTENSRLDNICFSVQIFDRKQLLGVPDDLRLNNEKFCRR